VYEQETEPVVAHAKHRGWDVVQVDGERTSAIIASELAEVSGWTRERRARSIA
jgi:hypothetical protein